LSRLRWLAVAVTIASLGTSCGGADPEPPPAARRLSTPPADAHVITDAVEKVLGLGTGHFSNELSVFGIPGLPEGTVLTRYGTYDRDAGLAEFRFLLPDEFVDAAGGDVSLPEATLEKPHLLMVADNKSVKVSAPAGGGFAGWQTIPFDQVEDQVGLDIGGAEGITTPPLLAVLGTTDLILYVDKGSEDGGSTSYSLRLDGKAATDLMGLGTLSRLVERVEDPEEIKELFRGELSATVTINKQGLIEEGSVDLAPVFRNMTKLIPEFKDFPEDQLQRVSMLTQWTFWGAGEKVKIVDPPGR
jgi:hypothetical protein